MSGSSQANGNGGRFANCGDPGERRSSANPNAAFQKKHKSANRYSHSPQLQQNHHNYDRNANHRQTNSYTELPMQQQQMHPSPPSGSARFSHCASDGNSAEMFKRKQLHYPPNQSPQQQQHFSPPQHFKQQNSHAAAANVNQRQQANLSEKLERQLAHVTQEERANLSEYFNQRYNFQSHYSNESKLSDSVIDDYVVELAKLNKELNDVKSQLNDKVLDEWRKHTEFMHIFQPTTGIVKANTSAELCTRAWCKFYDILAHFDVAKVLEEEMKNAQRDFKTLHICEAPGAFIAATNHYCCTNDKMKNVRWKWTATTLNPYHEAHSDESAILDDNFMLNTWSNWDFGSDNTDCDMVTADGSIDCQYDPANQEAIVRHLHYCEAITAITCLREGGSFILKMFTLHEPYSVSLMYLLKQHFNQMSIYKPACSKPGNSEVYVICMDFKPLPSKVLNELQERMSHFDNPEPLIELNSISSRFWIDHIRACKLFNNRQMLAIQSNMVTFNDPVKIAEFGIEQRRRIAPLFFILECGIKPLREDFRLIENTNRSHTKVRGKKRLLGSCFTERQEQARWSWLRKVERMEAWIGECKGNAGTAWDVTNPFEYSIKIRECERDIQANQFTWRLGVPVKFVRNSVAVSAKLLEIYSQLLKSSKFLSEKPFSASPVKNEESQAVTSGANRRSVQRNRLFGRALNDVKSNPVSGKGNAAEATTATTPPPSPSAACQCLSCLIYSSSRFSSFITNLVKRVFLNESYRVAEVTHLTTDEQFHDQIMFNALKAIIPKMKTTATTSGGSNVFVGTAHLQHLADYSQQSIQSNILLIRSINTFLNDSTAAKGDCLVLRVEDCISRFHLALLELLCRCFYDVLYLNPASLIRPSDGAYYHHNYLVCLGYSGPIKTINEQLQKKATRLLKGEEQYWLEVLQMDELQLGSVAAAKEVFCVGIEDKILALCRNELSFLRTKSTEEATTPEEEA